MKTKLKKFECPICQATLTVSTITKQDETQRVDDAGKINKSPYISNILKRFRYVCCSKTWEHNEKVQERYELDDYGETIRVKGDDCHSDDCHNPDTCGTCHICQKKRVDYKCNCNKED